MKIRKIMKLSIIFSVFGALLVSVPPRIEALSRTKIDQVAFVYKEAFGLLFEVHPKALSIVIEAKIQKEEAVQAVSDIKVQIFEIDSTKNVESLIIKQDMHVLYNVYTGVKEKTKYRVEIRVYDKDNNYELLEFNIKTKKIIEYSPGSTYESETYVWYEKNIYKSKHYIEQHKHPDPEDRTGQNSGWVLIDGKDFLTHPKWRKDLAYPSGSYVWHKGKLWHAKWWAVKGNEPANAPMWEEVEADESNIITYI